MKKSEPNRNRSKEEDSKLFRHIEGSDAQALAASRKGNKAKPTDEDHYVNKAMSLAGDLKESLENIMEAERKDHRNGS